MADYTRQDGNAMRRDAMQRARQMQQRVPYRKKVPADEIDAYLPFREESAEPVQHRNLPHEQTMHTGSAGRNGASGFFPVPAGMAGGIEHLLEQIDTDRMLILALLVMLYKDGSDKKLMMALAYLLT